MLPFLRVFVLFFRISINMPMKPDTSPNIVVDKEELRNRLTPMEYQITQEKGTERYDVPN